MVVTATIAIGGHTEGPIVPNLWSSQCCTTGPTVDEATMAPPNTKRKMNNAAPAKAMSALPEALVKTRSGRIARRRTLKGMSRGRRMRAKVNVTAMQSATNIAGAEDVALPMVNNAEIWPVTKLTTDWKPTASA